MLGNPSVSKTATATLDSGAGTLLSCSLCAGSDAATAVVRTGGSGGTIICKLGAAAASTSVERHFKRGVPYSDLHVTLSGTDPTFDAEVAP